MSDDLVKQSIEELRELMRCRCHPAYTDRKLHDSECMYYMNAAVNIVADRIEELEARLAKAVDVLVQIAGKKDFADDPWIIARTTLAELTGGNDD